MRLLLIALLLASPALALEPYLVKDINPFPVPGDSVPASFGALGSAALFSADGLSGRELWRSDGTAGGTWQVAEICAEDGCSGNPVRFAVTDRLFFFTAKEERFGGQTLWASDGTPGSAANLGVAVSGEGAPLWVAAQGVLYFAGRDGDHGAELWRTDGTPAGTYMVADLLPGATGSAPLDLTLFKGRVYFGAAGPKGGALWRSDGTARGTVVVKELGKPAPAVSDRNLRPFYLQVLGKRLVFAADAAVGRHDLWASDGTAKGTVRLTQWTRGTSRSLVLRLMAQGSRAWVVADDGRNGQELWVTDGTAKGTRSLTRFSRAEAFYLSFLVDPSMLLIPNVTGGRFVFGAFDGPHGLELWSTDGTVKGTRLVKDVCPGECHGLGSVWVAHQGRLHFAGNDGVHGWEPWVSDGTEAGTRLVRDICPGCDSLTGDVPTVLGSRLILGAYGEEGASPGVWATDGTEAGTDRLSEVTLPAPALRGTVFGGKLLFAGTDAAHGDELWSTDGTDAGTSLVRDVHDADLGGSAVSGMRALGDLAIFLAEDGVHGYELWKSDGTEAGTALVAELIPGPSAEQRPMRDSDVAGGKLFFVWNEQVWVTDGTEAGTSMLDGPRAAPCCSGQIRAVGNRVFIPSFNGESTLWVSDGTAGGTRQIAEFGSFEIHEPVEFQGKLYFLLHTGGWELWRSDGTEAGTVRVEELGTLPHPATPGLTVHAGSLWYVAGDGEGGLELRHGTGAGAALAFDVAPSFAASLGAKLLVSGIFGHGYGLWATDGTPAGTQLLGPARVASHVSTVFQGRLYYDAPSPSDNQRLVLWVTDGTPEGTAPLLDREGAEIHPAADFAVLGNLLLFTGDESRLLWQTDGTAAGTFPVRELGAGSSLELVRAGSRVFFPSYDPATGLELWAVE